MTYGRDEKAVQGTCLSRQVVSLVAGLRGSRNLEDWSTSTIDDFVRGVRPAHTDRRGQTGAKDSVLKLWLWVAVL